MQIKPKNKCRLKWKKKGRRYTNQLEAKNVNGAIFMSYRVELKANKIVSFKEVKRNNGSRGYEHLRSCQNSLKLNKGIMHQPALD